MGKKILVIFLLLSLSTILLFAGGEKEEADGPVTINFMADNRSELVKMQELLPAFEAETGIKVNWMQLQETPLRSRTGLELSAPSTDIDVIMADFLYMNQYALAGYLAPLDEYFKNSSTFKESDFQKPFIDAVKVDGKMYGIPLYQDSNIMVYRADLFAKYNLDVPKTFEELEAVAKVIHEQEPGVVGIVMRGQRGAGVNEWTWPTFLRGFGGSYFTADGKQANLDTPEAIAALEYYANILNKYGPPGAANHSYIEVQTMMMQGEAGIFIDSASLAPRCEDPANSVVAGKLGYAVVPGKVETQPGFYAWTLVVPENSARKEAAAKFLEWIISPEIAKQLGWSAPNQALESVYDIPPYPGYAQSEPLVKVMKDSLALADPDYRPRNKITAEVGTRVSVAISEVLSGEKSAAQALREANDEINRIIRDAGL
jgi:multiple sugar transport system substrate-binding protein